MNEIVIERKDSDHLIVKESDNSSSSVSEDITRYEEKWTDRHEEFLKQMKLECNNASIKQIENASKSAVFNKLKEIQKLLGSN